MGLFKKIGKVAGSLGNVVGLAGDTINLGKSLFGKKEDPYKSMKQGLEWRVADAKRSGIHPLAALGANIPGGFGSGGGIGLGDAVGSVGDSLSRMGQSASRGDQKAALSREEARLEAETASRIRVNETQAMLNEAQSRSIISKVRSQPTITSQLLDPSHAIDPDTGRLMWFMDASGKYHKVDQTVAPSSVLEEEYGEASELQGLTRAVKSLPNFGGYFDWPSINDLRAIFTR